MPKPQPQVEQGPPPELWIRRTGWERPWRSRPPDDGAKWDRYARTTTRWARENPGLSVWVEAMCSECAPFDEHGWAEDELHRCEACSRLPHPYRADSAP